MMNKYIAALVLLTSYFGFSQKAMDMDTIHLKIDPPTTSRVILYEAKGAKQKYVSYSDAADGTFDLVLPKNSHKGMYRLLYDQKTMDYIDFLYTGQSLSIFFNPNKPLDIPVFVNSDTNKDYYAKLNTFGDIQAQLDSLQVVYFQVQDSVEAQRIKQAYSQKYQVFQTTLTHFTDSEKSDLVKDLVLANVRVQPEEPIKDPTAYLPYIKAHFFDTIDFNNEHLLYSSILIDKVMDYVFYLTVAKEESTQNKLYKKAIIDVMQRIDNQELKSEVIQALIQSYAKDENIVLTDFLIADYYQKLPKELQNDTYISGIQQDLKTAVGRKAEDFSWKENDEDASLYKLDSYDYYVIVFWSATCPHCLKEIPKLHEFVKDKINIKVIAIGIETEESQLKWQSETYYYPEFSNVLALGKWENPLARSYNVYATPTYYILNADKKIINKPYEFVDLKEFFEKNSLKSHE